MDYKNAGRLCRQLNRGRYLRSFSILLYSLFMTAFFALLPSALLKLSEAVGLKTALDGINGLLHPLLVSIVFAAVTLRTFTVSSAVSVGEKAWYSGRLSGGSSGKRLRYWFSPAHSFKALRLCSLLFLLKLMWSAVFLSPALLFFSAVFALAVNGGIELWLLVSLASGGAVLLITGLVFRFITVQRYFLAPYLMARNPRLGAAQCVRQSKNILDGHIGEIVKFKLKFMPAFLLYPLIIPVIFLHPHYKQACSVIAKEICL